MKESKQPPSNFPADPRERGQLGCDKQVNAQDFYKSGEEKFGRIGSWIYSQLASRFLRKFHAYVTEAILSYGAKRILDLGCGPGDVLFALGLKDSSLELYGIDPSPFMLGLAARKMGDLQNVSVRLMLGSSRAIQFTGTLDLIFTSLSFHHWKDSEESIPFLLARLNNNGVLAIYEYNRDALPFLLRLIVGKHALSFDETEALSFEGYEKKVELNGRFLCLRFEKR